MHTHKIQNQNHSENDVAIAVLIVLTGGIRYKAWLEQYFGPGGDQILKLSWSRFDIWVSQRVKVLKDPGLI